MRGSLGEASEEQLQHLLALERDDAHPLASTTGQTAYDSMYVALAVRYLRARAITNLFERCWN
jgi:hypothetical protein